MGAKGKSRWLWLVHFGRLAGCVVVILAVNSFWNRVACAERNRSLLFVVDSSERMDSYLSSVKDLIFSFVDQSKRGDNIGIISFSDVTSKIALKKITRERDRQSVAVRLDAIEAVGPSGDVAAGVARALEEMGKLKRKGDKNIKGIIIISSSRSPDEGRSSEILEAAKDDLSKYVGKNEWYIQYCYLNGVRDRHIASFVSANLGLSYDVDALQSEHGAETIEELYRIVSTPEELSAVGILDLTGAILGKDPAAKSWRPLKAGTHVPEGTRLRVAINSRAVMEMSGFGKLGLAPESELTLMEARKDPLTGRGLFKLALDKGSIWLNFTQRPKIDLTLKTASAVVELCSKAAVATYSEEMGAVHITSFSDSSSMRVIGSSAKPFKLGPDRSTRLRYGETFEEIEPAAPALIEKWKSWRQVLARGVPLDALDFSVPELLLAEETIAIGPIKSGEMQSRSIPIRITGVDDVSNLKMKVDVSLVLPEGLAMSTGVIDGEDPDTKILRLKLDGRNGFQSRRKDTYIGFLNIAPAKDSRVVFERMPIPLTIATKGPIVPTSVLLIVAAGVLFGAIALGAVLLFRSSAAVRPRPHSVIGRLIAIDDPTGGRVGTINLEEVGTKSSRLSLLVGRDRTAEVRLRHASVNPEHCTIEAHLAGGRLETLIEPIGSARVEVNGETIGSAARLNDGAKIGIGDFTYQFEDSQLYKKVEIVRRNGRQISGILDAAGIDAEGFRLSPMDAVSPSERARVKFADIRYATFYRRVADVLSGMPRPTARPETMKTVELMFRRGNTISGYVQREYVEGRRRYVELLPLDPASEIDYTVVDYSAVVEKRTL